MLRFHTGELNLAPRLPGGPLRTSLLVGSVIALAAARVDAGGARRTAMVPPSECSPELSGISPYAVGVAPIDPQHGPQLARFGWQTLGARRAGIIYLNSDDRRRVRRTFA